LAQIRIEDREVMAVEAFRHSFVGVIAPDHEASLRGGDRGDDTQMRHPGKADDNGGHQSFRGPKVTGFGVSEGERATACGLSYR
jgi:hypothetical protein